MHKVIESELGELNLILVPSLFLLFKYDRSSFSKVTRQRVSLIPFTRQYGNLTACSKIPILEKVFENGLFFGDRFHRMLVDKKQI